MCAASGSDIVSAQEVVDTTYIIDTEVVPDNETATYVEEATSETIHYNKEQPTDEQWQKAVSDKAFTYKNEREFVAKKQTRPPETPWLLKILIRIVAFFASTIGKALLWVLLGLLVSYILYRILSGEGQIFARKNRKIEALDEAPVISEEDLLHSNWADLLRTALSSGDQRMTIRYSYMYLLQLLQSRDLIQYRQDKTNTNYYHELSGHTISNPFRQITRQYEYAWYGNFLPSKEAFETYLQTFNDVKKQLGAS